MVALPSFNKVRLLNLTLLVVFKSWSNIFVDAPVESLPQVTVPFNSTPVTLSEPPQLNEVRF